MTISCQEDKTEFLRLLETLYDAEYNGKPYVTLRDLGNDHLFDRQWVLSIAGAYSDVVRSEEHRPPTGGRTSTQISLACDYVEALGAVTKIQCDEDQSNGNGNSASSSSSSEDDLTSEVWERCVLIAGLVRGVVQPEHVLAYALHYYRIVDRDKALSAIDYAAEELLVKGLCEIALDGDIKLMPPGLAQAKRLVQMPTADPVRRAHEKYEAFLISLGKRGTTISSVVYGGR